LTSEELHSKDMNEGDKSASLTNAEIADRLSGFVQPLTVEKADTYKIRAYRTGADVIRGLGESLDELVRSNERSRLIALAILWQRRPKFNEGFCESPVPCGMM
jgi:hypothetical protein